MRRFFLTGALARPDLLKHVCDQADWAMVAYTLADHALAPGAFPSLPGLEAAPNKSTDGMMVMCDPEQAARLLFFAQCFELEPMAKQENGKDLTIFLAPAGSEKDALRAQDSTYFSLLCDATPEIMGYYGRLDARDVAKRMPMILSRAHSRLTARKSAPASVRSTHAAQDVMVHKSRATHEGYFLTETCALQHPTFAGGLSDTVIREVFVATDAAIVLPYDPKRDRVLLVEQFRMGPFGRGDPLPWVLEPVAGRVDPGEAPETTARRECAEEAGLELGQLEHVSSHYCSPGCSTELFHCYVGLCGLPDMRHGQGGLETEHEDIRTHVLSFEDALELVRTGEANIGPLVLLLLWLERERPRLRSLA